MPGLSVAVTRNGRFVYEHQFGMADRKEAQQVLSSSLFRIASVTKPITSVTIFTLIEQGKLNLADKVFGPSGVLGTKFGKPPYQQYVTDITVDQLLTHTCGGWPNDSTDPMMRFKSWDQEKLITWTLKNLPLTYPPGQHWAYSNFGYCVLGRVIEQVTGQPYADYVQSKILAPCGIGDMRIAGNKLESARSERSGLLRTVQREPIRYEHHPHGLAWRLAGDPYGPRPIPEPRNWVRRHSRPSEAGNHPGHDHAHSRVSAVLAGQVCPRLDGTEMTERATGGTTAAFPDDDHHGAHLDWPVLGGAD